MKRENSRGFCAEIIIAQEERHLQFRGKKENRPLPKQTKPNNPPILAKYSMAGGICYQTLQFLVYSISFLNTDAPL